VKTLSEAILDSFPIEPEQIDAFASKSKEMVAEIVRCGDEATRLVSGSIAGATFMIGIGHSPRQCLLTLFAQGVIVGQAMERQELSDAILADR
jgi:hypothetical protein